jgi:hypothetical protein
MQLEMGAGGAPGAEGEPGMDGAPGAQEPGQDGEPPDPTIEAMNAQVAEMEALSEKVGDDFWKSLVGSSVYRIG